MKKLLIPSLLMSVIALTATAQAETMSGKIVSKQNEKIQVSNTMSGTPTTFKTTPNTNYYIKKKITKDNTVAPENTPDPNDIVEIVYTVDPATNELIIDEMVIFED